MKPAIAPSTAEPPGASRSLSRTAALRQVGRCLGASAYALACAGYLFLRYVVGPGRR